MQHATRGTAAVRRATVMHQKQAGRAVAAAKNGKPRKSGALVQPVPRLRRHRRAASFDEWHFTSPDLRRQGLAAAASAGDIRTVARNLALCIPGTGSAVLRISGSFLRPR